jgi:cation diffusion facilitator CzcD-associated flavoprotein CzcO
MSSTVAKQPKVAVVGAGITGLLIAQGLKKVRCSLVHCDA